MFRRQEHDAAQDNGIQTPRANGGRLTKKRVAIGIVISGALVGGLVWWQTRPAHPPLTPLQQEQVSSEVEEYVQQGEETAGTLPKGSAERVDVLLNYAVYYANHGACEHAKDLLRQAQEQRPDEYVSVQKTIDEKCS